MMPGGIPASVTAPHHASSTGVLVHGENIAQMTAAKIGISKEFGFMLRNDRRSWSIASLSALRFAAATSTIPENMLLGRSGIPCAAPNIAAPLLRPL